MSRGARGRGAQIFQVSGRHIGRPELAPTFGLTFRQGVGRSLGWYKAFDFMQVDQHPNLQARRRANCLVNVRLRVVFRASALTLHDLTAKSDRLGRVLRGFRRCAAPATSVLGFVPAFSCEIGPKEAPAEPP